MREGKKKGGRGKGEKGKERMKGGKCNITLSLSLMYMYTIFNLLFLIFLSILCHPLLQYKAMINNRGD